MSKYNGRMLTHHFLWYSMGIPAINIDLSQGGDRNSNKSSYQIHRGRPEVLVIQLRQGASRGLWSLKEASRDVSDTTHRGLLRSLAVSRGGGVLVRSETGDVQCLYQPVYFFCSSIRLISPTIPTMCLTNDIDHMRGENYQFESRVS